MEKSIGLMRSQYVDKATEREISTVRGFFLKNQTLIKQTFNPEVVLRAGSNVQRIVIEVLSSYNQIGKEWRQNPQKLQVFCFRAFD